MSTELVAIERINIKKDNGDADALRSCLAHYLQQFLDSASIESMTLHELTIRIGGEPVLNVSDKTGGVGLSGLDKDWQRTETVHKAIEQIILDADVEVFLSYDMIHYFSNKNFYGSAFWMDTLQEFGIISRAGEGTKIILTGDPNQVDNPLLDSRTNGLTYAANAMKGSKVCTQITFAASECERSELAKEAIKRMQIKGKNHNK